MIGKSWCVAHNRLTHPGILSHHLRYPMSVLPVQLLKKSEFSCIAFERQPSSPHAAEYSQTQQHDGGKAVDSLLV